MARILILEDDEQFREFLQTILTDDGYQVDTVADGRQGLAAVANNHFDMVITDIFMPEIDGLQFLLKMRKKHPDITVIGMSGGGARMHPDEVLTMSKEFGAKITINKPFTKNDLLPLVRQLLKK